MPWSETTPMRERIRFWQDYERGIFEFKELCGLYGISRKTGYKLIGRILEEGLEQGIRDRPRVARNCPHRTEECLEDALVEIRRLHPRWGPRKIVAVLEQELPQYSWPAPSTVGDVRLPTGKSESRSRQSRSGKTWKP